MITKDMIVEKAQKIGFDLVGFTTAEPFHQIKKILRERKKNNKLSPFMSHDLELLTNPKAHLSSAKSIISLAMSYASSKRADSNKDYSLSIYSQGLDYHNVFAKKISKLIDYIHNNADNVETKSYVDTGPILDRAIAERAGLGWIGKNNNLINQKYGSYIFLGEIIINLEFPEDKRAENLCADCTKCIDSCPGGALEKEKYINPDKCIGYLTQKKGIIPINERKLIGNNLWGCDTCQRVCPYNQDIEVDLHEDFEIKLDKDIEEILSFTQNNFPKEWKNSALSWRGVRILKRNALIVIANKKLKSYKEEVIELFDHPSSVIRAYAYWTYSQISNNYYDLLTSQLKKEKTPEGKKELKSILNKR